MHKILVQGPGVAFEDAKGVIRLVTLTASEKDWIWDERWAVSNLRPHSIPYNKKPGSVGGGSLRDL